MSRSAEYAIRGFLYQFNKSLLAILRSENGDEITLEGIVEDLEVFSPSGLTAIQCKYHSAADSFAPSKVFEPLLQMMLHYHHNQGASIRYILFGHYPGLETDPPRSDLRGYVQSALRSKNLALRGLISELPQIFDIDGFVDRFSMEVGPDLDTLISQVCVALGENGIPADDIDTLAYPNAVNMVAMLSTKADVAVRTITKASLLASLIAIRRTAISRWTMALRTRKKLLEAKRKQLKPHLSINSRLRCFLINFDQLGLQVDQFVSFVRDYLNRYHFKPAHNLTPIFCISSKEVVLHKIIRLLFEKGVKVADGFVAGHFEQSELFREPICARKNSEFRREFHLRLVRWEDNGSLLGSQKCDDLFVIGDVDLNSLNTFGWEIEQISTSSLAELKFILGVSDVID
jgi:hypothetical protein